IILVVGLSNWCAYARVVRAETLAIREKAFVDAARALGVPHGSIVRRHVLPNVSASLIVVATFGVAGAIPAAAGLFPLAPCAPPARGGGAGGRGAGVRGPPLGARPSPGGGPCGGGGGEPPRGPPPPAPRPPPPPSPATPEPP